MCQSKPEPILKVKPDLSTPENREYWAFIKKQHEFWDARREEDQKLRGDFYAMREVLMKIANLTEEIYLGDTTLKGMQTIYNIQKANEIAKEALGIPTTRTRLMDLAKMVEGKKCLVTEDGVVVGVELVEDTNA